MAANRVGILCNKNLSHRIRRRESSRRRRDGVDGVAGAVSEMIAADAVLGLEMADARLDGARRLISRLIWGVTRRFGLAVKTLNLSSGGASWPR